MFRALSIFSNCLECSLAISFATPRDGTFGYLRQYNAVIEILVACIYPLFFQHPAPMQSGNERINARCAFTREPSGLFHSIHINLVDASFRALRNASW